MWIVSFLVYQSTNQLVWLCIRIVQLSSMLVPSFVALPWRFRWYKNLSVTSRFTFHTSHGIFSFVTKHETAIYPVKAWNRERDCNFIWTKWCCEHMYMLKVLVSNKWYPLFMYIYLWQRWDSASINPTTSVSIILRRMFWYLSFMMLTKCTIIWATFSLFVLITCFVLKTFHFCAGDICMPGMRIAPSY